MNGQDGPYLRILLDAIRVCSHYQPKFGKGRKAGGLTLSQFRELYRQDPFYSWFGLDSPLMYSAHKAAGGMTSVYRQIGMGCERLVRRILQDSLELSEEDIAWSYRMTLPGGKTRTLHLDGRVSLARITDAAKRARLHAWMNESARLLEIEDAVSSILSGVVLEIRQGYKSKDSKRQNADIANAATAYTSGYLPCAVLLSRQIDDDVLLRYRASKWVVLTGIPVASDPLTSTYDFMRDVIGYDLAAFFERNREILRTEIDGVLRSLLAPEPA